ncbi:hypothetical protein PLANPX_5813 [Lacipirellula parvula]|uniref:Uncharacterized protein n=1 Tax=Lacipirellula parvula TaxID=2650471 RepID=A0A5K7XLJ2_9BACT|nr:hypothetical protein PLANPX_5813 [Lacipirellula parvula]
MLLSHGWNEKSLDADARFLDRTSSSRLVVMLSRSRLGSFQYQNYANDQMTKPE